MKSKANPGKLLRALTFSPKMGLTNFGHTQDVRGSVSFSNKTIIVRCLTFVKGISSHWTFDTLGLDGTRVDYAEKVAAFDARVYAETLAAAGARHCIFTLTHAKQYLSFPLAELGRILPGRTAGRDLVGDLVRELHAKGIRFIAYYNHSCNGNDDVEWRRQGSPCRRVSPTPISPRTSGEHRAQGTMLTFNILIAADGTINPAPLAQLRRCAG